MNPDANIIDKINSMTEEEIDNELHAIVRFFPNEKGKDWFKIYNELVNDKRAYELLNIKQYYPGNKRGELEKIASLKLRLLSYYVWRNEEQ